jgi:hypothetical protein
MLMEIRAVLVRIGPMQRRTVINSIFLGMWLILELDIRVARRRKDLTMQDS